MYGYINGKITDIEASYVILENNGMGYLIDYFTIKDKMN